MKLLLQMGYGMADHANHLINKWGEGTVILSPRDQTYEALNQSAKKIRSYGGEVLLDPQFYLPHSNHHRLIKHSYWPQSFTTSESIDDEVKSMVKTLITDYNDKLETSQVILPGCFAERIDDQWCSYHESIVNFSKSLVQNKEILATIALSYEIVQSTDKIHELLECISSWDVDGFYIVPERPRGEYLVQDPIWILNLMDLCSSLHQIDKKVIVGYSNHQLLPLVLAGVDGIASGNWINVRSFSLGRFNNPEESDMRNSAWYYCPQALSEYQLRFLDVAKASGVLNLLKTDDSFKSEQAEILFSGAQPSSTDFQIRKSFLHYLHTLKVQVDLLKRSTYQESKDNISIIHTTASKILSTVRPKGVRGKYRDFSEVIDVNLSAIDAFDNLRGFVMAQIW